MSENSFMMGKFGPLIDVIIRENEVPMIVVYKNPRDFPGYYAARLFSIKAGKATATRFVRIAKDYESIRASIPLGFMKMSRNPQDDPCIVESWV